MARSIPPQQPPPAMRLLVQYGKRGPARFASHRDFARCCERALLRAKIPMAYSSGFNPHQRISYINPSPTGAESVAEYLILALSAICNPADVRTKLAAAMPVGFPVIQVSALEADMCFEASVWQVRLVGADVGVGRALEEFVAADEVVVSRQTKNGLRSFDARGPVESIRQLDDGILQMTIRHTEPLVRPDDVVSALATLEGGLTNLPTLTRRVRQGRVTDLV